jgi:hypothetical protein
MDAWWDIEGFPWDYCALEIANTCPADKETDWSIVDPAWIFGGPILGPTSYAFEPDDGWVHLGPFRLNGFITGNEFSLRLHMVSDSGIQFRGVKLDDITITNIIYDDSVFPPVTQDFIDPCDDMSNWCLDILHTGQYWKHMGDATWYNFYDINGNGLLDKPGETYVPDLEDGLIWHTEIKDCYEAFLSLETVYDLQADWNWFASGANPGYFFQRLDTAYDKGYIQIRETGTTQWFDLDICKGTSGMVQDDLGGPSTWGVSDYWLAANIGIDPFVDPDMTGWHGPPALVNGGWVTKFFDITAWAGKDIEIRFLLVTDPIGPGNGEMWGVRNMQITGKQDHTAPTSSITMSGTMKDSGWYASAVKVKITAEDTGSGVKEIHYILDGVETVVAGDTAEFTISGNGIHTLEYWAVDNIGNEEAHHTVPSFKIDSGAAPTVAITAPEPGIYLFGKKILSSSNVFIIGAFTIEATASDADSGIYKLAFYLDDQLLGEDTEAPYSQYVASRHMGAGTIKVTAEDFAQNVAEDTLDLKYYKFF